MSAEKALPTQNTYEFALANLLGSVLVGTLIEKPYHELADGIQEVGFHGFEWTSTRRGFRAERQLRNGQVSAADAQKVISQHQGFRNERSLGEAWAHPRRGLALGSYVLLPHRLDTLAIMEQIQEQVGHDTPAVLYSNHDIGQEPPTHIAIKDLLFQPTAREMALFNARDLDDLIKKAYAEGFTDLVPDLAHFRASFEGRSLGSSALEILEQLLDKKPAEIHVGLGRFDVDDKELAAKSMKELEDLVDGRSQASELVKMLQKIQSSGWRGRVVIEVPVQALRQIGKIDLIHPFRDLMTVHEAILKEVQSTLG